MNTPTLGHDCPINVDRLIETRAIALATSGAGKSWLLRRLLEQTHGQVQQIVLDVEGEFGTLREKFDYVLAGKGGECEADPRSAALLARRLLELRVSAIIDIYELKQSDRIRFARLFLESLVNAPKDLWHPVMVVIDEAHVFAPENGRAESAQAVIDLMNRGRKRGFCGVLATQRPAALAKDASASAVNKMIGRCAQDIDVKRAAEDIGFYRREDQAKLRALQPGEFFVTGPAFGNGSSRQVWIGEVQTTHPKAGQRGLAPPPPRAKVQAILAKLADLPKDAEQEAGALERTIAELRIEKHRAVELARQLAEAKAKNGTPDPEAIEKARAEGFLDGWHKGRNELAELVAVYREACDGIEAAVKKIPVWHGLNEAPMPPTRPTHTGRVISNGLRVPAETLRRDPANTPSLPAAGLSGPEQRILDAIAWLDATNGQSEQEQTAVAFMAGYTIGGGGFNNPRGALRTKGLVEYVAGEKIRLTSGGMAHARTPKMAATSADVQAAVMARLPGPERKILQVLIDAYPKALSNADCASRAGYTDGGGGYNNPRGRLRTIGLIEYQGGGMIKAREILFV